MSVDLNVTKEQSGEDPGSEGVRQRDQGVQRPWGRNAVGMNEERQDLGG